MQFSYAHKQLNKPICGNCGYTIHSVETCYKFMATLSDSSTSINSDQIRGFTSLCIIYVNILRMFQVINQLSKFNA